MVAAKPEPVCSEPKVFVGQIPMEATESDVQNLFSQFGTIKQCSLIKHADGRSKGCAMVLYGKWVEAEAAVESEHGTTHLGGNRIMVVKYADPPKRGDGPIVGIAPKKLFVGQVPSGYNEPEIRQMFQPFGNIVEVHVLHKNPGAGCAFVTYSRWGEAEAAISALDNKFTLEGAKATMVVRFADAKLNHINQNHVHMNGMAMHGMGLGAMGMNGMNGMAMHGLGALHGMGMPGMHGMAGMPGMMGNLGLVHNVNEVAASLGLGTTGGVVGSRQVGIGMGIKDENAKQWKLFVGQVPYEATEPDLWPIFSSVGTILELVILRANGKSKGCGFVTYENRMLAEKAIRALDGQAVVPSDPRGRPLIVKFAGSGKAPA